jgi:hypothetical protein
MCTFKNFAPIMTVSSIFLKSYQRDRFSVGAPYYRAPFSDLNSAILLGDSPEVKHQRVASIHAINPVRKHLIDAA